MENRVSKVYKVAVDRKLCISAGTCIVVAPNAFELDEEGVAILKPGYLNTDDDTMFMAAQSCPTQAILLFNEAGEQIFPVLKKE